MVVFVTIVGFGLAVMWAFVREYFERMQKNEAQAEKLREIRQYLPKFLQGRR
jgi:hypothetical protein